MYRGSGDYETRVKESCGFKRTGGREPRKCVRSSPTVSFHFRVRAVLKGFERRGVKPQEETVYESTVD